MTTIRKYSAEHQSIRDTLINEAVRAGKIQPSRVQYWSAQFDADPEGTQQWLAKLQPAPAVAASTHDVVRGAAVQAMDYDENWLTAGERRRITAATSGEHHTAIHAQD